MSRTVSRKNTFERVSLPTGLSPTTRSGVAVSTRDGILSNPLRGPKHGLQLWVAPRQGSSGPRFDTLSVRIPKHKGIRSDTRRIHEICSDRNSVDCVSSAVRNEDTSIYVDSIVDFREYAGRTPDTSPRRVLFYWGSSQPSHPTVSGVTSIHLAWIYTHSVPSEITGLNSGFLQQSHTSSQMIVDRPFGVGHAG